MKLILLFKLVFLFALIGQQALGQEKVNIRWFEKKDIAQVGGLFLFNSLDLDIIPSKNIWPQDSNFTGFAVSPDGIGGFHSYWSNAKKSQVMSWKAMETPINPCHSNSSTGYGFHACFSPVSPIFPQKYLTQTNRPFSISGDIVDGYQIPSGLGNAVAHLALQTYLQKIKAKTGNSGPEQYEKYLRNLAHKNQGKKFLGIKCFRPCLVLAKEISWALRQVNIYIENEVTIIDPKQNLASRIAKPLQGYVWEWLPKIPNINVLNFPEIYPWLDAYLPVNLQGCRDHQHPSLKNLTKIHVMTYGVSHLERVYYRIGAERPGKDGTQDYRDIIVSADVDNNCQVHSDKPLGQLYSMERSVPKDVARLFAMLESIFQVDNKFKTKTEIEEYYISQAKETYWVKEQLRSCDRPCLIVPPEKIWVFKLWKLNFQDRIEVIELPLHS